MNPKQQTVLFKRTYTLKDGSPKVIWWYYVSDENGKRHRSSLGTSLKTEAKAIMYSKMKSGELWPAKGASRRLQDFARQFWEWESCPYLKRKRLRGERITPQWTRQNRGYLTHHILPVFGTKRLCNIKATDIENFLLHLRDEKDLSNKSINNIFCSLRIILEEARQQGILSDNPARNIKPLKNCFTRRGILSPQEAKLLFSRSTLFPNHVQYAINFTACATGARLGELRALKVGKILPDRIVIDGVFRRMEGYVEGDTKTGRSGLRIIPIPPAIYDTLKPLLADKNDNDFIFTLHGNSPISGNTVT